VAASRGGRLQIACPLAYAANRDRRQEDLTMSEPVNPQERERLRQQKIQRQLDEALADSFPASDPVSIVTSQQEEWDRDTAPAPTPKVPPTP
jgi:hypothetical protein